MRKTFEVGSKVQGREVLAVCHGSKETVILARERGDDRRYVVQRWHFDQQEATGSVYGLVARDAKAKFQERVHDLLWSDLTNLGENV